MKTSAHIDGSNARAIEKGKGRIDIEDIVRLLKALPPATELHLLILKGHLITEQLLFQYIATLSPNPGPLLGRDRVSFSLLARIAESLDKPSKLLTSCMWEPMRRLNKLRNALSHELTPLSFDDQIDRIIKLYELAPGAWKPREYRTGQKAVKLRFAIAAIHQFMAGAIITMRQNRATHEEPLGKQRRRQEKRPVRSRKAQS